jgi:hypothetical protein
MMYHRNIQSPRLKALAEKIAFTKLLPIRNDFLPMKAWPNGKEPTQELQQQFGIQIEKSMRQHAISSLGNGSYVYADIEHELISHFVRASIAKAFRLANCDACCSYILDYLLENDLNIPFTILTLNNYRHVFVVLGVKINTKEYVQRREHLLTDQIYNNTIILDLWNLELPLQTPEQFQQAMANLFARESSFFLNPSAKNTKHEFSVRCLFHLPQPTDYRPLYINNVAALKELQAYYESNIRIFLATRSVTAPTFFSSAIEKPEIEPGCCGWLIESVTNFLRPR